MTDSEPKEILNLDDASAGVSTTASNATQNRTDHKDIAKMNRKASFDHTMQDIQTHMSPLERAFSKFIHHPIVEYTSDIVGNVLVRPAAILIASLCAFVFTLVVYLVAKHYGYSLSGFESIGAFIGGWLIGNLFDYVRVLVTGQR